MLIYFMSAVQASSSEDTRLLGEITFSSSICEACTVNKYPSMINDRMQVIVTDASTKRPCILVRYRREES